MSAKHCQPRRQSRPEFENDLLRSPALGYESADEAGVIRCLAHGFPTPLARWHYHDEYELHLIVATTGKSFVGDWIGQFEPGHLVLTGPRLPHNWVSMDPPGGSVAERDLVIQFPHEPIVHAARHIPELAEVLPLLERSRHGIEFFGLSQRADEHWHRVKSTHGIERFTAFCAFLADLAACTDYRLLMESDRQITDICYVVGFNNVSNFNRRFLSIKGMTPRDFRRQIANRFGGRH